MKKTVIILLFAVVSVGYGQTKKKRIEANEATTQNLFLSIEDTVRYQIGGKLYGLDFRPSDSITVIKSFHWQDKRQYDFIVHNRYSYAHRYFETSFHDSIYNSYMSNEYYRRWEYDNYLKPRLDSIQSRHLDSAIKDFNGYWVYLKEYNGDYYLNDDWNWRASFYIADSIFTNHFMDGPFPKKLIEAISFSENGISILYDGEEEPVKIELFDKFRHIYKFFCNGRIYFIAPARAIHNFEIIQYTNTTGDMI